MSTKAERLFRRRQPRTWCLATIALVLVAQDARGQSALAVDRLLKPQKLVVEIFHEPGIQRLELQKVLQGTPVSLASLFAPGGIEITVAYRNDPIPRGVEYERIQQ